MNTLVTGGADLIGTHLVRALVDQQAVDRVDVASSQVAAHALTT
jgi:nucleoside-diphosphate-sugar epimerase